MISLHDDTVTHAKEALDNLQELVDKLRIDIYGEDIIERDSAIFILIVLHEYICCKLIEESQNYCRKAVDLHESHHET